jgi:hypothetical protein
MHSNVTSRWIVVTIVLWTMTALLAADTKLSRESADTFQQKVSQIVRQGDEGARSTGRRTPISESELNSWFAYRAQPLLPNGVAEPSISILGQGKLAARAIVDLDAVSKKKASGGTLDPWSYIGGRVPVTVAGILHTKDGVGQFQLESAEVSGVPVPKTLLQQLVSYYSRTSADPDGVNLDAPFELPAGIRLIEVDQGQAVIVQ